MIDYDPVLLFAQRIAEAPDIPALLALRQTALPHLIGILDAERRAFEREIDLRMIAMKLNNFPPLRLAP